MTETIEQYIDVPEFLKQDKSYWFHGEENTFFPQHLSVSLSK